MKFTIGEQSFEVPEADAGILEDHEAEVRTFLTMGKRMDPEFQIPVGADAAAIVTLMHALARKAGLDLSREQVRVAIGFKKIGEAAQAVASAFGFEVKDPKPGEAVSP